MGLIKCPFCSNMISNHSSCCIKCKKPIEDIISKIEYTSKGKITTVPFNYEFDDGTILFVPGKTTLYAILGDQIKEVTFLYFDYKNNRQVAYFEYNGSKKFALYPGNNLFTKFGDALNSLNREKVEKEYAIKRKALNIVNEFQKYTKFDGSKYNHSQQPQIEHNYLKKVEGKLDQQIDSIHRENDQKITTIKAEANKERLTAIEIDRDSERGFDPFNYSAMRAQQLYDEASRIEISVYSQTERIEKIKIKPYIARLDCGKNPSDIHTVYIGETDIEGCVVSWRNENVADAYYLSDYLLGSGGLYYPLKRIFKIDGPDKFSFDDEFNLYINKDITKLKENGSGSTTSAFDDLFTALLEESRKKKEIHNIVKTIKSYQFVIISYDSDSNILVDGCAGSGKTMILYHRLSYLIYNTKKYEPENIFAITPTRLFASLTNALVKSLELDKINNFSYDDTLSLIIRKYQDREKLMPLFEIGKKPQANVNLSSKYFSMMYYEFFKDTYNNLNCFDYSFKTWFANKIVSILRANNISDFQALDFIEKIEDEKIDKYVMRSTPIRSLLNTITVKVKKKDVSARYILTHYSYENMIESVGVKTSPIAIQTLEHYKSVIVRFCSKTTSMKTSTRRDAQTGIVNKSISIEDDFGASELLESNSLKKVLQLMLLENAIDQYNDAVDDKDEKRITLLKAKYSFESFKKLYANNVSAELFEKIYLLRLLIDSFGPIIDNNTLLYIDEFQNYSLFELETLKALSNKSVINLFGDFNQKMDLKGIDEKEKITGIDSFVNFTINDNLRNAKEITEYVNKRLSMNMSAIGLRGTAKEVSVKEVKFKLDGRTAIIGKNINDRKTELASIPRNATAYITKDVPYSENRFNIMNIEDCKGLEFETVYIFEKGLSDTQLYIGFTRALSNLIVIKG